MDLTVSSRHAHVRREEQRQGRADHVCDKVIDYFPPREIEPPDSSIFDIDQPVHATNLAVALDYLNRCKNAA
jgi:hypothetical protein